jgi:hypothetical protein
MEHTNKGVHDQLGSSNRSKQRKKKEKKHTCLFCEVENGCQVVGKSVLRTREGDELVAKRDEVLQRKRACSKQKMFT